MLHLHSDPEALAMNLCVMHHSLQSVFTYHPLLVETLCPGGITISSHLTDEETETQSCRAVCPRNTRGVDSHPDPQLQVPNSVFGISWPHLPPGMSEPSMAPAGLSHVSPAALAAASAPFSDERTLRCHPHKGTVVRKD